MKFAIVNNLRTLAKPKLVGKCICCREPVRAYCGNIRVHHWKHVSTQQCDPWYENETEWHRKWKDHFNIDQQEVVMFDKQTGEKHIADIYIESRDLVLEFQHSPIEIKEIKSRQNFYKRMIWILDVKPYSNNISFYKNLSEVYNKYITKPYFEKKLKRMDELRKQNKIKEADKLEEDEKDDIFYNNLKNKYFPHYDEDLRKATAAKNVLKALDIEKEKNPNSKGGHSTSEEYIKLRNMTKDHLKHKYLIMIWKYKHKRWKSSELPLFFDIGDDNLYRNIEDIKYGNGFLVKKYSKQRFINKYRE